MEQWLPIPNSFHEVSSHGRVRNARNKRLLKLRTHSHGYLRVWLGAQREEYVHRLVCEAFNGPCPLSFQCDHINRDRADNRPENLRWVSAAENKAHRVHPRGEAKAQAKLTAAQVDEARDLFPTMSNTAIGALFGVHRRTVADIRNGVTWQ